MESARYLSESAILRQGNFLKVDHFGTTRTCEAKEDDDNPDKMNWFYTIDEALFINTNTEVSL